MKKITLLFVLLFQVSFALPPTGASEQYFCEGTNPTIADLQVQGTDVLWFSNNDSSGTPLTESTPIADGVIYYAFDSSDSYAEGLAVQVVFNIMIPAPIGPDFVDPLCNLNQTVFTVADLVPLQNTSGFNSIFWYDSPNQNSGNLLELSTPLVDGQTYYAFQAIFESNCIAYYAYTYDALEPIPAPTGNEIFYVNQNTTFSDLPIENTDGFSNLYFFDSSDLSNPANALPFSASVQEGITYYAAQSVGSCVFSLPFTVEFTTADLIDENLHSVFNFSSIVNDELVLQICERIPNKIVSIAVFSVTGRMITDKYVANENQIMIDFSYFTKGVYFLKLKFKNNIYTAKIIKK